MSIQSRAPTAEYRDGWDRIFGKRPVHAGWCGNINAVHPDGLHIGAAECGCQYDNAGVHAYAEGVFRRPNELLNALGSINDAADRMAQSTRVTQRVIGLPFPWDLVPIIHKDCGNITHYYAHRPRFGEGSHAEKTWLPDGTQPKKGEPMICAGCGVRHFYKDVEPQGGWAD